MGMKIGRNDPCPCGSGKKYKHCCIGKKSAMPLLHKFILATILVIGAAAIVLIVQASRNDSSGSN